MPTEKTMKTPTRFASLVLIPFLAMLTACGGGSSSPASTTAAVPTPPPAATLKSIAITPVNPTISIGTSTTLIATGTFSDGKTTALTASANGLTWTTKGNVVAVVFTSGLVTAKAVGTDTVTASVTSGTGPTAVTVTGSTELTVVAPWTNVSAGGDQTLARKADGNLYSWGANLFGQLGDGTSISRTSPALVSGGSTLWKQVASGDQFVVALRSDGTLWSWGLNQVGQLGDGTTTNRAAPAKIGTATDWVFVAAGKRHAFAINNKGVLFGWGGNFNGQLGDSTTVSRLVPTLITGFAPAPKGVTITNKTWKTVAAGDTHTLGIDTDNGLYGWGGNASGQIGNNSSADAALPTKIGASVWASVSAGSAHSTGIRTDGTLFAWGSNSNGQVGNVAMQDVQVPAQITTANNWAVVSAGAFHTMATRTDGSLWGWGANGDSQLGNGGQIDAFVPAKIGKVSNWNTVSAGAGHTMGIQNDNTLWGWGRNLSGQVGNGKLVTEPEPVNIP